MSSNQETFLFNLPDDFPSSLSTLVSSKIFPGKDHTSCNQHSGSRIEKGAGGRVLLFSMKTFIFPFDFSKASHLTLGLSYTSLLEVWNHMITLERYISISFHGR